MSICCYLIRAQGQTSATEHLDGDQKNRMWGQLQQRRSGEPVRLVRPSGYRLFAFHPDIQKELAYTVLSVAVMKYTHLSIYLTHFPFLHQSTMNNLLYCLHPCQCMYDAILKHNASLTRWQCDEITSECESFFRVLTLPRQHPAVNMVANPCPFTISVHRWSTHEPWPAAAPATSQQLRLNLTQIHFCHCSHGSHFKAF